MTLVVPKVRDKTKLRPGGKPGNEEDSYNWAQTLFISILFILQNMINELVDLSLLWLSLLLIISYFLGGMLPKYIYGFVRSFVRFVCLFRPKNFRPLLSKVGG